MSMCACNFPPRVRRDLIMSIVKNEGLTLERVASTYPCLANDVALMKVDLPVLVG